MKLLDPRNVCALGTTILLFGCAAPEPERPPAPEPEKQQANTWTPQAPIDPWWQEGDAACPDGAHLVGAPPPEGKAYQCVLENGEAHGPSTEWFPNGHEGTYAEFKKGVLHGRWVHWLHNHRMIEGAYENGRKHGKWVHWFDSASDFDMDARWKPTQPTVVETYNKGLLIETKPTGRHDPGGHAKAPKEPPETDAPTE